MVHCGFASVKLPHMKQFIGATAELIDGVREIQEDNFVPSDSYWVDDPAMAQFSTFQDEELSYKELVNVVDSLLPRKSVLLAFRWFHCILTLPDAQKALLGATR